MQPRIAFLLPDLGGGGVERLTLDLMHGFRARGAAIDLVLMARRGEFLPLVPEGVRIIDLAAPRLRKVPLALRRYLDTERPDAMLAAMWPLTSAAVVAAMGLRRRPRLVLADHCPLLEQYAGRAATLAALRATLPLTYRRADAIVAVSQGLAVQIGGLAGLPHERIAVVPNPIPPPLRSADEPWSATAGKRILAVGRLKAAKNFALLIDAFAPLAGQAHLAIVGEGGERAALAAQAARLGVAERVQLPGFTATPGDWYAGADLFVLPSDYEGFGNVLVEAMHYGLPVVSTDCPHGPREILGSGRWGTLVPCGDAAAMTKAMREALAVPRKPEEQRARAEAYAVDPAIEAYWRLLVPA